MIWQTPHVPLMLEEHEWSLLRSAFAGSVYLQTITLLHKHNNRALPGKELFADHNMKYGEEVINAYFHRKKLPFQMKRFEQVRYQARKDRKFAIIGRPLEKQLELPLKPDLFQRRSGNRP